VIAVPDPAARAILERLIADAPPLSESQKAILIPLFHGGRS